MIDKSNIITKDLGSFIKPPNLINYEEEYKNFSASLLEIQAEEFKDKKFNAAYNLIDRHAKGKKKNSYALLFEPQTGKEEKYTYLKLKELTDKFANVLKNLGLKKGDRFFIFLPTIAERHIAFISGLKLGVVVGTLFPAFQEIALQDRLLDSEAKVVITTPELFERIKKIWKDMPNLEKIIIVERDSKFKTEDKRVVLYEEEMRKAKDQFAITHLEKEEPAYILYTSGTTGKPKGIVHSHKDVFSAILTTKLILDVKENDVYWCTADIGWVTGVVYGVLGILGLGGTCVIYEGRFSPQNWYKLIEKHKVSVWYTAPTAIRMLMGSETKPKDFDLSSLRFLASVGEPLNPEAIWWGLEVFGKPFHDTWWQTELGSITISNYGCMDIKPGSMGKPFLGIKAGVIDDEGNEVSVGEEGNLAIKTKTMPSLMIGIWKNDEKFRSCFIKDWYVSGDRAYIDEDGYFWFFGRRDDVIKTSGERVGPFEVESALVEHLDVTEAGVIGKPDEVRGEIIKAFVVLKPGVKKDEETKERLKAYVKNKLSGHLYPREIEFIEKLPKTRSGKIMRRVLKAKELGLPVGDTSTLEDF